MTTDGLFALLQKPINAATNNVADKATVQINQIKADVAAGVDAAADQAKQYAYLTLVFQGLSAAAATVFLIKTLNNRS